MFGIGASSGILTIHVYLYAFLHSNITMATLAELTKLALEMGKKGEEIDKFVETCRIDERDVRERRRQVKLEDNELMESKRSDIVVGENYTIPKIVITPFNDKTDSIKSYLRRFEALALGNSVKREHYSLVLNGLLNGKSLFIYDRLTVNCATDYDVIKKELLNYYRLSPMEYRHLFFSARILSSDSPMQAMNNLERFFDWVEGSRIESTRCNKTY